jgi:sugar lactone lactonase YvrE
MGWKRILGIIAFIMAAIAIGVMIYWFFFRPLIVTPVPTPTPNENAGGGGLVPANQGQPTVVTPPPTRPTTPTPAVPTAPAATPTATGGLTAVTPVVTSPTIGATMATDGQLSFYNRDDGKFYRLTPDGKQETLSNKVFYNVKAATFNPQGNGAILEYPDQTKFFYDFSTNRQYTIPTHWNEFQFSPSGDRVVTKSMAIDPGSRYLVIANPDGSGAKAVQELGTKAGEVQLAWAPNNQIVATASTGTSEGLDRRMVYLIGQNQENFKGIMVEGLDFRPKWSPTGNQLLYSVTGSLTDWRPTLWVTDASGEYVGANRKMLNLNTWADKCAFAGADMLYCAVPQSLERGAGLQPDVADATPDDIYRIDMRTGLQSRIAIPEGDHTVGAIMVSPDGKNLFFTDKGSGLINKIELAP